MRVSEAHAAGNSSAQLNANKSTRMVRSSDSDASPFNCQANADLDSIYKNESADFERRLGSPSSSVMLMDHHTDYTHGSIWASAAQLGTTRTSVTCCSIHDIYIPVPIGNTFETKR
jgi:hypothetical protein